MPHAASTNPTARPTGKTHRQGCRGRGHDRETPALAQGGALPARRQQHQASRQRSWRFRCFCLERDSRLLVAVAATSVSLRPSTVGMLILGRWHHHCGSARGGPARSTCEATLIQRGDPSWHMEVSYRRVWHWLQPRLHSQGDGELALTDCQAMPLDRML
jgi:hypothetical protein